MKPDYSHLKTRQKFLIWTLLFGYLFQTCGVLWFHGLEWNSKTTEKSQNTSFSMVWEGSTPSEIDGKSILVGFTRKHLDCNRFCQFPFLKKVLFKNQVLFFPSSKKLASQKKQKDVLSTPNSELPSTQTCLICKSFELHYTPTPCGSLVVLSPQLRTLLSFFPLKENPNPTFCSLWNKSPPPLLKL